MKFNPGDPVWVRSYGAKRDDAIPAGEHAGIVVEETTWFINIFGILGYSVTLCQSSVTIFAAENRLRPRRDDYQQKKPLGSRADLDKSLLSIDIDELNLSEEQIKKLEEIAT
jgi:hypothetical protein